MRVLRFVAAVALSAAVNTALQAQTDFFNTDRGRPLAVEDAVTIEYRALELQAAPLLLQRPAPGVGIWGVAPSLAWGLLPRTQIELGVPLQLVERVGSPSTTGAAGVEVELLHQLNTETLRWPSLALGAGAHLPAGPHGPARTEYTIRGLATRSLGWGRVHVNGVLAPTSTSDAAADPETLQWMAGLSLDRTWPLKQLLVGWELTASELRGDAAVQWRTGIGFRRQRSSRVAVDAGVSRALGAGGPAWALTIGGAYAFARPLRTAPRPRGSSDPQSPGGWSTVAPQFYLQAPHNFVFRRDFPAADNLFNAFDYGHAILYETLWMGGEHAMHELEGEIYAKLTGEILVRPPRLPVAEAAVEPRYARLAPEAKAMFEWAHILHRQVYDVLADARLDDAARDRELQLLLDHYRSRPDLAFSAHPKSMALMQEQPYSLAFRQGAPKFNGLIWAYHWLQVGLYEPLLVGQTAEARQAGVAATVARFRQMMQAPPDSFPVVMPMTAAIAPEFARRWPTLAIIFDNLHSMHDVISDILANPSVPRDQKRAVILRAAAAYRDDTTEVMSVDGWRRMSVGMGVENQGGPASGFLPALPTPTMPRGAVMRHDHDGNAVGGHRHEP